MSRLRSRIEEQELVLLAIPEEQDHNDTVRSMAVDASTFFGALALGGALEISGASIPESMAAATIGAVLCYKLSGSFIDRVRN